MSEGVVNAFAGMPKMARLSREMVLTEKIDGTNAQIFIAENSEPITLKSFRAVPFLVGSRTRWIFPENDNHGFAKWAYENAEGLLKLGPGRHFGEWYGQGINRGYGLKEKRFALFNALRWATRAEGNVFTTVPVLYQGPFDTDVVDYWIRRLAHEGSKAVPGYMDPEGVVVFHVAGNVGFKKTINNDEIPKSVAAKTILLDREHSL